MCVTFISTESRRLCVCFCLFMLKISSRFSTVIYIVFAAAVVYLHRGLPMAPHIAWQSAIIALIGAGSVCFHSTLRYNQQLWDEIPMYW